MGIFLGNVEKGISRVLDVKNTLLTNASMDVIITVTRTTHKMDC